MTARRVVRLGQEAFVLSHDGEVVRTMVAKFEGNGYRLLNGDDGCRPHRFSFEEAVSAASDRISARQTVLRKELRMLTRKRRALETQDYRDCVMNAPYRVVDLRDTETLDFMRPRRPRKLKNIQVPKTYLMPGHMAYAVITPMTRPKFEGMKVYRPHRHFVLETEVRSVCFSPDGQVHYTFATPFVVEEFFLTRDEAIEKFRTYSEWAENGLVHCVTSEQEKEENKKLSEDDDIPF